MTMTNLNALFGNLDNIDSLEELKEIILLERQVLGILLDNLPSSIYIKDSEGRKILANKANYTQAGFDDASYVIGKTDFDMFPKHLAEKFHQDDRLVLEQGRTIQNREEQVISAEGEVRWQVTEKYPLRNDDGDIIGLFGFGHDITSEKSLEEENLIVAQKIKDQEDMVEQMIVDLSAIPAKISNLVDGIGNISKQTKMVAINAAIEAARVGEYGRGFEIVAREVGELSDQSGKATIQVRESIEEVNSLIQKILQLWEEVRGDDS